MARPLPKIILIGLLALLAVQLTGLSCLSDFGLHLSQGILLSQSNIEDSASILDSTGDGCPCHLFFHTVSPLLVSVISPFVEKFPEWPRLAVSDFSRVLFHPPSLT